jgi:gliding motility-associated-like protein
MTTYEGSATISNASGQLLFYSNGVKVWNRNHQVLPNGGNLKGDMSTTQGAIFIPKPGSNTIYYLFALVGGYPNGLTYSEIDITLNGGLGDVTSNKNIQLYTPTCEKICAIKNTSNNSYWVITHGFENNSFLTFSVDSTGVNVNPVISNEGSVVMTRNKNNKVESIGHMKISPDGSKLVSVNTFKNVQLFDFNILTGRITNPITLNTTNNWSCYGAEFSPSGNILYLTASSLLDFNGNTLLQYNLQAPNIADSETIIHSDLFVSYLALQLAPNCKIYCSVRDKRNLHCIDKPDILGVGCDFQSSNPQLRGRNNAGLTQFIQNSNCKDRTIINDDICIGGSTTFSLGGSENITTALWRFGDGNTSTNINGQNNYSAAGTYIVSGEFTTPTGNFSISKQITVPENPIANTPEDVTLCGQTNLNYDLSALNSTILGNQSANIYGISYFASLADATSHTNILSPTQTYSTPSTVVYAKVYRLSNFDCHDITSFKIILSDYPVLNPISEFKICDDEQTNDGFATFDLTTKTTEFLNGQSPNDFKVSYHLSLDDAQNNLNPIISLFTNTTNPQTIYARIATLPAEKCFQTTSFSLVVKPGPELNMKPIYTLCEGNGNFITINLPNSFDSYLWSNGNQTASNNIATPGNYWVSVSQNQDGLICSRTINFEVALSNKATLKKITFEDWTYNENSILIIIDPSSLGDYEYSIDGIHYQDSNFFEGLLAKEYTVFVRDKNGCGITTDEIFLLTYPKFFTPNDDGYNDEWSIQFSETEPNISIKIFDRYGKLLSTFLSWNGKFEGKPLPSDDYWFVLTRENGKEYKGHFTLKR